jgi:cytochrome c-type biogenesis protein
MQLSISNIFKDGISFARLVIILGVLIFVAGTGALLVKSSPFANTGIDDSAKNRLLRKLDILPVPEQVAPMEFSLPDTHGQRVSMARFKGKVVFLNFWTTWCRECRNEMSAMERLHRRLQERDFVMVAISLRESAKTVKRFMDQNRLTFTALLDKNGDVGTTYAVRAIPTTFILDRRGHIIGMALGARKWDTAKTVKLFERLLEVNTN